MMTVLYDLIYLIAFLLYAPVLACRGKLHRGYRLRFGHIAPAIRGRLKARKNIWIHAVSVGEVLAIVDMIRRLKAKFPEHQIVLTTVTKTGFQLAHQQLEFNDIVLFAPMDLSWVVKRFIALIEPKIYIAAETEVWPNLYRYLHRAQVPIVQINGRISDKSYKGYRRIKPLIGKTLALVDHCLMQSELDKERIVSLGACADRVQVTGNIKFDNLPDNGGLKRPALGYAPEDLILMAGSTHPGEEEILLDVFLSLRLALPGIKLIMGPRHVERVGEVKAFVDAKRLVPVLQSGWDGQPLREDQILIVDRIGMLKNMYAIADVVFIGKTLAVGGGQNMIEPAAFGKPVVVGPMTYNFRDVMRVLLAEDAVVQVPDARALGQEIKTLLYDKNKRERIGAQGKKVVEKYKGASARTVAVIEKILTR